LNSTYVTNTLQLLQIVDNVIKRLDKKLSNMLHLRWTGGVVVIGMGEAPTS